MSHDASAIFRSEVGYGELERLSALETLKGLKQPDTVTLGELVRYLDSRGLWNQFAKITLADLRDAFSEPGAVEGETNGRRKKRRILEDEFEDVLALKAKASKEGKDKAPENEDGGIATEEFARRVMPFIEGNGDVTLDDIEEYVRLDPDFEGLDRKVLRHHIGALVREGRLERIGVGRHAIYSSI